MRDYKVKREIPFKDKKKGKILNCNPIDLLVVFNTKKSNFVFAPTNKFIEIQCNYMY